MEMRKNRLFKILASKSFNKLCKNGSIKLPFLTEIGAKSSLRYSVQLLSLAAQNAGTTKRKTVTVKDVERVNSLFMDVNEAAEHLRKYENKLMYH